jgi:hypothetical protein
MKNEMWQINIYDGNPFYIIILTNKLGLYKKLLDWKNLLKVVVKKG